jgi:hypothetical protein
VTDLTQSSAYVNWATSSLTPGSNSGTPGSLKISPVVGGTCPSSTTAWSSSALPASTKIPYQAFGSSSTTTSWSFTVVNGAGTTIDEYQDSVKVTGLTPGTTYCYAAFSTDKSGATDLLAPSSTPSLASQKVQTFTTLQAPSASSTAPVTFDVLDDTGENYACTTATNCSTEVPYNSSGPPVNPDEAALYDQIGQSGAQFLLDAGDTGYNNGSQTNLGDLEQTGTTTDVSNFFGPSYYPLTGGIPYYLASGDHNQNNTALKVFPTPANAADSGGSYSFGSATDVDGITADAPADWYAFSTGNVRIYVIDAAWGESASSGKLGNTTGSLCGAAGSSAADACRPYQADNLEHWQTDSAEYQWLQSDLSNPAYASMVKFAVFHFPLQSDNPSQPSDLYAQNSSANPEASTSLEAMLSKYGVEMAFNGHAHTYQRFDPDQPGQIVNYVTGGGGGVLEPVEGPTTNQCKSLVAANASVYAIGWSPSSNVGSACGSAPVPTSAAQVFNFLKVTVSGATITVSPTDAAGQIFDQQTYTDAALSPPPTPSAPSNVTATATSSTTVQLSWNASTESGGTIASYQIERNGEPLTSVSGSTASYIDMSVQPDATYTYTVTAVDGSGTDSAPGSSNQVTTPAGTSPPAGPTLVQSASSSTNTVSLAKPSTAGDLLVLASSLSTGATNHITKVTDSAGDTWSQAVDSNVSGHDSDGELWYLADAPSVSSVTVTTGASSLALQVDEFSGVSTLDSAVAASADSTTAASGPVTPSLTGELAIGFVAGHGSSQTISTTSEFTDLPQTDTGTTASLVAGYEVLPSMSAQAFSGTFAKAMYWAAGISVFRAA